MQSHERSKFTESQIVFALNGRDWHGGSGCLSQAWPCRVRFSGGHDTLLENVKRSATRHLSRNKLTQVARIRFRVKKPGAQESDKLTKLVSR